RRQGTGRGRRRSRSSRLLLRLVDASEQRVVLQLGVATPLLVALAPALLVLLGAEGWLGGDRVAHAAPSSISETRCGAVPIIAASRSRSDPPTFASVAIWAWISASPGCRRSTSS